MCRICCNCTGLVLELNFEYFFILDIVQDYLKIAQECTENSTYIMYGILLTLQWRIQDFSEEGAPTTGGAPRHDFIKISRKLHEIKENSARGGAHPLHPPLDPPLHCPELGTSIWLEKFIVQE